MSIKRVFFCFALLLGFAIVASAIRYGQFRSAALSELVTGTEIVETRRGPIEYQLSGTSGPIVLFLHGTPGGADQGPTDQEGFRFLTPSRPGYLNTALEVGATPQEQADAFAALLDALEIDEVIVMGVSGGGPSALSFTASYPERVMGLVALEAVAKDTELDPMPGFFQYDFALWAVMSLMQLQSDQDLVAMLVPDVSNQALILEDPKKLKEFRKLVWSLWPQSLRGPGMANDREQFAQLDLPIGEITVPTLIIHGTADINVDVSHGDLLANEIAEAEMLRIEGADHMLPLTHREQVSAALSEFAASLVAEP